jgi:hypothetical protein
MLHLKLHSFVDNASYVVIGLVYVNLISACMFTISCGSYIPTVSYLATFRTHDLVVVMALTLFACLMVTVFISWHMKTHKFLTFDDFLFMIILEVVIFILSITVSLIDESNGIEFNPVDHLHHFLSFTLCIVVIIWSYYALSFLEVSGLTGEQRVVLYTCWVMFKVGAAFAVLTLYQWHFAYTIYNNVLTNPFMEALCEWILITIALRFPAYLVQAIGTSVTILSQDKEKA